MSFNDAISDANTHAHAESEGFDEFCQMRIAWPCVSKIHLIHRLKWYFIKC